MEIGTHCNLSECHALDFLPIKCDACSGVFCERHMQYENHRCPVAPHERRGRQVPVCPLCNCPVPLASSDESVDLVVGRHIDNDCRSQPALDKRSQVARCVAKGCRKRDLTSIKCGQCDMTVCIRHRLPEDHDCSQHKREQRIPSNIRQQQLQSHTPSWLHSGFNSISNALSYSSHQGTTNTSRTVSNRPSSARSANSDRNSQRPLTSHRDVSVGNAGMSESEALQAALAMSAASASETPSGEEGINGQTDNATQEELDRQLALMIQQEQMEIGASETNRPRITANSPANNHSSHNNCSLM